MLLVEDHQRSADRIIETLSTEQDVVHEPNPQNALLKLPDANFELLIVSLSLNDTDGLRLCSQVRSLDRIRHMPILIIVEPGDDAHDLDRAHPPVLLRRRRSAMSIAASNTAARRRVTAAISY